MTSPKMCNWTIFGHFRYFLVFWVGHLGNRAQHKNGLHECFYFFIKCWWRPVLNLGYLEKFLSIFFLFPRSLVIFELNFPENSKAEETFFPYVEDCKFHQNSESVFIFDFRRIGAELQGQTWTPYENGQFSSDLQKPKFFLLSTLFCAHKPNFTFFCRDLWHSTAYTKCGPRWITKCSGFGRIILKILKTPKNFKFSTSNLVFAENFTLKTCAARHFLPTLTSTVIPCQPRNPTP